MIANDVQKIFGSIIDMFLVSKLFYLTNSCFADISLTKEIFRIYLNECYSSEFFLELSFKGIL